MAIVRLYAIGSAIIKKETPNLNIQLSDVEVMRSTDLLYFLFENMPQGYALRPLEKATINIFFPGISGDHAYAYATTNPIKPFEITWNSRPERNGKIYGFSSGIVGYYEEWGILKNYGGDNPAYAAQQLLSSCSIELDFSGYLYTEKSQYSPYIEVTLLDEYAPTVVAGKTLTAGFVNRHVENTFKWELGVMTGYYTTGKPTQKSALFRWRTKSEEIWNEVEIKNEQEYTAPAWTLPSSEVEWQVIAEDSAARSVMSPIYTFSTIDTAAVATPIAPSNTVEDGEKPISFEWEHSTDTGTEQTAAELQWSSDGSTWNNLVTVSGNSSTYSVPANTFPGGTVYWRVRTYNSDNIAGDWSSALSFISIAAPPVPVVAADSKPFATIRWQTSGQLAYTVKVDGVEYGPYFGTNKEFALRERLGNGNHRATVKVQGAYGLWSEEGSTEFQISNIPGAGIILKAEFSHVAQVSWQTQGDYTAYQVYRNGKLIGKTAGTSFVDNLAIGNCSYLVVGIMADGNYTESNIVNGQINLCCTMICDLERGEWQKLELSAKSYPERNYSLNQQSSSRHFCGAALPVLELSQHRNINGSYEVAFQSQEKAAAFVALLGKVVCIKSKPADMIIGGLLDLQKLQGEFYAAYSFSVSAIYWEDYRDDTDS